MGADGFLAEEVARPCNYRNGVGMFVGGRRRPCGMAEPGASVKKAGHPADNAGRQAMAHYIDRRAENQGDVPVETGAGAVPGSSNRAAPQDQGCGCEISSSMMSRR